MQDPEYTRAYNLNKKYKITPLQYRQIFLAQDRVCKVCGKSSKGTLHVDHDHVSGKIRGLLCSKCNTMLGLSDESIETLNKAIQYIKENMDE